MSSVDFVLEKFNYDLEMGVAGQLPEGEAPPSLNADATAVYYVSVTDMRNTFYFQSDSTEIDNGDESDLKYFVNWPSHFVLNPCHAYIETNPVATTDTSGNLDSNRLLVKHDFIRHIAKDLFNTHFAVDLLNNEQELKDDLASKGHTDVWVNNIKSSIDAVSIGGALAPSGFTTNATDISSNLCRTLLKQVLHSAKSRLYDLSAIVHNANDNEFYIPFNNGDSIQFKVVLKAEPTQHLVIERTEQPVSDRSYIIKLNIVDTVEDDNDTHASNTNVIVNDCTDTQLNDSYIKKSA